MEILPEGLVDSAIEWADGLGYLGLAILTSTEAALQPIPPDPLVWNMILEADSGIVVATVVLIATLSSVLGALAGYAIGMYGGGWLLERFVSQSTIARLNVLVDRYGSAGIFIAAVSPIPYKALAWIAGAGRMDLRRFVAAGIVGRGLRFGIPGALLSILWGVNEVLNDRCRGCDNLQYSLNYWANYFDSCCSLVERSTR